MAFLYFAVVVDDTFGQGKSARASTVKLGNIVYLDTATASCSVFIPSMIISDDKAGVFPMIGRVCSVGPTTFQSMLVDILQSISNALSHSHIPKLKSLCLPGWQDVGTNLKLKGYFLAKSTT